MRFYSLAVATALTTFFVAACSSPASDNGFGPQGSGQGASGNTGSGAGPGGGGFGGGNGGGNNGGGGGGGGTIGQVDKTASCDTGLAIDGDAASFAKALGVCTAADKEGFGLVSASYSKAFGSSTAPHAGQWGLLPKFGTTIQPREGGTLGVLSSGYAREYDNINGSSGSISSAAFVAQRELNGTKFPTGAAPPGFPKAAKGCAQDNVVNDMIDVKLTLKAPMDATGFQFDFDFYSSEWPNYVCSNYNDAFIAYLTSKKLTDNVSFDAKNNPVAVNNDYFDRCTSKAPIACLRSDNPASPDAPLSMSSCDGGPDELAGTGFAFTGATQCTTKNVTATLGGATGWLTTQAPIEPGETFTLEFMIWDAGDGALDSSVLLDNFKWIGGSTPPSTPSTTRVN